MTGEGVDLRSSRRVRVGLPATQQAVIVILGFFVALWAFDSSGADALAFLTFSLVIAFAVLAAWYVGSGD